MKSIPYVIIDIPLHHFCSQEGYKILQFTNGNLKKIANVLYDLRYPKNNFVDLDNIYENLKIISKVGKPDFFIYNGEEYSFVEFKTQNDNLRKEQVKWLFSFNEPAIVIHSLNPEEHFTDIMHKLNDNKLCITQGK